MTWNYDQAARVFVNGLLLEDATIATRDNPTLFDTLDISISAPGYDITRIMEDQ